MARYLKYLEARGWPDRHRKGGRSCGDGEMTARSPRRDRPRLGEKLDNLVFVVNATCSASTVRCAATGKIIQSSRATSGRGLDVIQGDLGLVLGPAARARQGRRARAHHGGNRDGEYQNYKATTARSCASISSASTEALEWSRA